MPIKNVSASFVHAASYASLLLQVSEHLFPEKKLFELSPDQRRIADNETRLLLLQARWAVDSQGFADQFAIVQVGGQEAPSETRLGEKPAAPIGPPGGPGGYA